MLTDAWPVITPTCYMSKDVYLLVQRELIRPALLVKVWNFFLYFSHENLLVCSDTCEKCTTDGCSACRDGFLSYNKGCVSSCPGKTYSTGTTCESKFSYLEFLVNNLPPLDCPNNCNVCESGKCSTCDTNYLLFNEICVSDCPAKMYSTGKSCESNFYFL